MAYDLEENLNDAAILLANSKYATALTGAGISVESGIPHFRGKGGLWSKYDPDEYSHIDNFLEDPVKVWEMLDELITIVQGAEPNPGHLGMAELERMGILKYVITQNVDALHQAAGSKNVIEFHGNNETLVCHDCRKSYPINLYKKDMPPRCECGGLLRPDVVLFGEPIPPQALIMSQEIASKTDVMLVAGTSAVVAPASNMPVITKFSGGSIIELNTEMTVLSDIADVTLVGEFGKIMPKLVEKVKSKLEKK